MNSHQLGAAVAKEIVSRWAVTDRHTGGFVPVREVEGLAREVIQRMFEEELQAREQSSKVKQVGQVGQ